MTCNYEGNSTSLLVLLLSSSPPEVNGARPSSIVTNNIINGHNVCRECKQSQSQRVGREKQRRKEKIVLEELALWEKMNKEEKEKNYIVLFFKLFFYADSFHLLFMVIGIVGVVQNGLAMLLMTILFISFTRRL
jgi:hypothetical protein